MPEKIEFDDDDRATAAAWDMIATEEFVAGVNAAKTGKQYDGNRFLQRRNGYNSVGVVGCLWDQYWRNQPQHLNQLNAGSLVTPGLNGAFDMLDVTAGSPYVWPR